MEYLRKDEITETLRKMVEARKKKMNCNRQSALEYQVFKYVLTIVEKAKVYNFEEN